MSLYDKVLSGIKKNRQYKQTGKATGIPYPFEKLSRYIPLIERGHCIGVLAPTGMGKSRLCRFIYIYHVYKFYKQTGYKVKIIYFPLEDNKEKVYKNIICHYLKDQHGLSVSLQELDSKGELPLSDYIEQKLEDAREYFEQFEEIVTILDGENSPSRIAEQCRNIANNMGRVIKNTVKLPDGNTEVQDSYESDYHVVCLIDNLSNIDPDDGDIEHVALNRFVKVDMRSMMCNFYGWTAVIVLQQDYESERVSYTRDGEIMVNKLEPALASVGDAKRVSRSLHLCFGMFSPARYDILKFPIPPKDKPEMAYDIEILGNRFRSLRILKSNDSDVGMRIGLRMDGISEIFEELPMPNSDEMINIYKEIANKSKYQQNR